jgi:hypothetical protein
MNNVRDNRAEALKDRTRQFTLRTIRVIRSLPPSSEGRIKIVL